MLFVLYFPLFGISLKYIKRHSLVAAALLLASFGMSAETLTGYVVSIADGDTITVLDANRQQHKIRLAGIDAPEKKQAFGERSMQGLAALVFGKTVEVEWRKEQSPADQRHYAEAEQLARAARIGLWGDQEAVAPWDWRHRSKLNSSAN